MADRIRVSTEILERWVQELRVIQDGLSAAEGILTNMRVSEAFWGALSLSLDQSLSNGARIASRNAGEAARSLRSVLSTTSETSEEISRALIRSAQLFAEAEANIDSLFGKSSLDGMASGVAIGAVAAMGVLSNAQGYSSAAEKARDWGRKKGTISDAEYACIANCANIACHEKSTTDKRIAFVNELSKLPPDHPLSNIDAKQVKAFDVLGLEGFVIELDNHNAIVVYAGTDDFTDIVADFGIATQSSHNIVTNAQKDIANLVISSLERRGFDNIQVTGHSLGGYMATDVAIKHRSVSECVTFDAPKHSEKDASRYVRESQRTEIRNYIPNGSIVNKAGANQPGSTIQIQVQENWAGPLHNHQIVRIYEDGLGGMDEINRQWQI